MTDINAALGIEPSKVTSNWFSFEGRARRAEYWGTVTLVFLVTMFLALPAVVVPICINPTCIKASSYWRYGILGAGLGILVALICLPVNVRRLHDRGMSGWWVLWFALLGGVPFVGWISGIVQFVIVGCMDGVPGPNEYGPDPKGRNWMQGALPCQNAGALNSHANVNATSGGNTEERLLKLEGLKSKGLISLTEYETKRSQIISEI